MKAVAYCRVSTNKEEQIDSLESQQKFFTEYAKKNSYNLIKIYADEGKSGTKIKNRTQLLKLLSDANNNVFDTVLIKDISRLARNTVDFLTSIRKLKSLNIKVVFVNYDQTSSDSSEFMLTMLSAIAQEESANTSKRVKFGKKLNAEKGRVPNLVYGYNKIPGEYFSLSINENEARIVRDIFSMYVNQNMGAHKISTELNRKDIKTKRNCIWRQVAVSRILTNTIYIGKVANCKQEVEDFLTGKRKNLDESNWLITENENLRIISDEIFYKAQQVLGERSELFNITGERSSEKNVFSKLIKCSCCNTSFRRQVRKYKNTYIRWVCGGRNAKGIDSCSNRTSIEEEFLLKEIKSYFIKILNNKPKIINDIINEFNRIYKTSDEDKLSEKELIVKINNKKKKKQKYIEMYEEDIISLIELKEKTSDLNNLIDSLQDDLNLIHMNLSKSDLLNTLLNDVFKDIEEVLQIQDITNGTLNRLIKKIVVDENKNVDIHLRLLKDIGLDDCVQIMNYSTYSDSIIERLCLEIK